PAFRTRLQGEVVAVADVLGDWREEIITTLPGEMRIYVTVIPSRDRRVCLMQDAFYRADVATASQGYYQIPTPRVLPGTER
ncbi:MAG TPA: silent information regulator protein Sir2, partial [Candidatus Paceibacterota bacterium]|nr:silent information regulator protein Sir2 [Candidatus Paceibacterota bacterium]